MKKEVTFLPVAALYGHNIKEAVTKGHCDWYEGGSLFETLDAIDPVERNPLAPVRLPIVDRWKEMGTILMGKIEAGFMRVGDVYQVRVWGGVWGGVWVEGAEAKEQGARFSLINSKPLDGAYGSNPLIFFYSLLS